MSDVAFDMTRNAMEVHQNHTEPWRVTLVDTGDDTLTGSRLKRVASYIRAGSQMKHNIEVESDSCRPSAPSTAS